MTVAKESFIQKRNGFPKMSSIEFLLIPTLDTDERTLTVRLFGELFKDWNQTMIHSLNMLLFNIRAILGIYLTQPGSPWAEWLS